MIIWNLIDVLWHNNQVWIKVGTEKTYVQGDHFILKNISLYFEEVRAAWNGLDNRVGFFETFKPHSNHIIHTELTNWHFRYQKEFRKRKMKEFEWIPLESWSSEEIGVRIDPIMLDSQRLAQFCQYFE